MLNFLENVLNIIAPITIILLELVGVFIILFGAFSAIINFFKNGMDLRENKTKILLGEAFSLGLEFKLGSEIIKTVVVRSLDELAILAIVVVLRVVMTLVIHWEIEKADLHDEFNKTKNEKQITK